MHAPIAKDPYKNVGITGFEPCQSHVLSAHPVIPSSNKDIWFPLVAGLNVDCFEWDEGEEEMILADCSVCDSIEVFDTAPTPHPPTPAPLSPQVPKIGPLTVSIISSMYNLFFCISYSSLDHDRMGTCPRWSSTICLRPSSCTAGRAVSGWFLYMPPSG